MVDITKRSVKGSPLTNDEVDDNFDNLNTGKVGVEDIGTDPNQVPLNQYLGSMAYQDLDAVSITGGTATLDSADIDGGTIDGVTIGGSSAGAITGTTGQFNTSLNVDGTVTADGLTVDGGDVAFYEDTGTNQRFYWDASREQLIVGFNEDPADAKISLRVSNYDPTVEGGKNAQGLSIRGGANGEGNYSGAVTFSLNAGGANAGSSAIAGVMEHPTSDDKMGLVFFTHPSTTSTNPAYERMRINADGDVGIGTSSPAARLDVRGAATFNEGGGDVDFRVESDNNTHALFVDAGNDRVGIGTNSPATALDVNGTVTADGADLDGAVVINESGADVDFRVESDTNTHRLFVDAGNDRVGMGTSAPKAQLETRGAVLNISGSQTFSGLSAPYDDYEVMRFTVPQGVFGADCLSGILTIQAYAERAVANNHGVGRFYSAFITAGSFPNFNNIALLGDQTTLGDNTIRISYLGGSLSIALVFEGSSDGGSTWTAFGANESTDLVISGQASALVRVRANLTGTEPSSFSRMRIGVSFNGTYLGNPSGLSFNIAAI